MARCTTRWSVLPLAGSALSEAAAESGLRCVAEAFADRAYRRVASMIGEVLAIDGSVMTITVESTCVQGDSPGAVPNCGGRAAVTDRGLRRFEAIYPDRASAGLTIR
jgi:lactam utilization protein B